MARNNKIWFEFAGRNSRDMGVYPIDTPALYTASARGTASEIAGRSGDLWLTDGAYETFKIRRKCRVAASRLREAQAWLTGRGELIFSALPDAAYDARISDALHFALLCPGSDPLYEFTVDFTCQPHPHILPAADALMLHAPGSILNPGTAPALPRITITGSGDFSLTIGKQTLFFTNVEDGLIVDSELGDALNLDGTLLMNDRIGGALFSIEPGENAVNWETGSEDDEGNPTSGHVASVEILPRWRYI